MNTKELIERIFKEPGIKFDLIEFENTGERIHDFINIFSRWQPPANVLARPRFA